MRSLWLTFGALGFQLTSSIDRRERKGRIEKNYVFYAFFVEQLRRLDRRKCKERKKVRP